MAEDTEFSDLCRDMEGLKKQIAHSEQRFLARANHYEQRFEQRCEALEARIVQRFAELTQLLRQSLLPQQQLPHEQPRDSTTGDFALAFTANQTESGDVAPITIPPHEDPINWDANQAVQDNSGEINAAATAYEVAIDMPQSTRADTHLQSDEAKSTAVAIVDTAPFIPSKWVVINEVSDPFLVSDLRPLSVSLKQFGYARILCPVIATSFHCFLKFGEINDAFKTFVIMPDRNFGGKVRVSDATRAITGFGALLCWCDGDGWMPKVELGWALTRGDDGDARVETENLQVSVIEPPVSGSLIGNNRTTKLPTYWRISLEGFAWLIAWVCDQDAYACSGWKKTKNEYWCCSNHGCVTCVHGVLLDVFGCQVVSVFAKGGVRTVLCPYASVESHMRDTIVAAAYLCEAETFAFQAEINQQLSLIIITFYRNKEGFEQYKNICDGTLEGLRQYILTLEIERKVRSRRLRDFAESPFELWNMMNPTEDEKLKFVFETKTILRVELLVLDALKRRTSIVTLVSFFDHIVRRFGLLYTLDREFLKRCARLLISIILDSRLLHCLPSVIAAATMFFVITWGLLIIASRDTTRARGSICLFYAAHRRV